MQRRTGVWVVMLAIGPVRAATAAPAWGGNCLSCHGQLLPDAIHVFGEDGLADPDESGTGAPDRGPLKVFQGFRGHTEALEVEVSGLSMADAYAVELKRLRFPGVENGGRLTFTGDCDWAEWSDPGSHYSDPAIAYRWQEGPTTFSFDIDIHADAPYDYYDLVFAVAGRSDEGGGLFYDEEHFYLQVAFWVAPGDMDEDGDVGLDDFARIAGCLNGPEVTTPPAGCEPEEFARADLDDDGDVDLEDFAVFAVNFTG